MMGTGTKVKENLSKLSKPKFIPIEQLIQEQLTDPDYRLKQLLKQDGANPITCSRCHHCRGRTNGKAFDGRTQT